MWIEWDSHRTETAWNGRIDDLRVYSYALAAEQVQALYEATRKPPEED